MDPNLLDDLRDLHGSIEHVFAEQSSNDTEACSKATQDSLALIESLAILHCDIHRKVLASRRDSLQKMGCREVLESIAPAKSEAD